MKRFIYFSVGLFCLVLGLIGVVLPLLPTTPFVILAAFCFSKSSPRFHKKLLENRIFGPMIADWERYGVIPFKVKCISSSMMVLMISYPVFFKQLPLWADISMLVTALIALFYIWSRPSQPAAGNLNAPATND